MVTVILGLSALSIVLGYMARVKDKNIEWKHIELSNAYSRISMEINENVELKKKIDKLDKKIESMKQVSNNWILEKEQHIKKLEQEKFDQLHELALMLNDSYHVDEIILSKAEKFDWLVNSASREQKRNFIKGWKVEEV